LRIDEEQLKANAFAAGSKGLATEGKAMFVIKRKEVFSDQVKLFEIEAPQIARHAHPGEFIVIISTEHGERIPLTIADYDPEAGTVTVVFQEVGKSTMELGTFEEGDSLYAVTGPLGKPTHLDEVKKVVCIGGGLGIACIYPIARGFHERGAHVISIIGARSKDLLYFEDRMRAVSEELLVTTDDGSHGRKGVVTEPLKEILERDSDIDRVMAVGPAIMMKYVAATTKPFGVKTIVSLNSIMVDGTGMCGGCRVEVGGKTKFCCVDGPEFDAHEVDFDLLMARQSAYLEDERVAVEQFQQAGQGGN
jgi:ferredoxin--NADP+ reductase